jgi:hypothetical protein
MTSGPRVASAPARRIGIILVVVVLACMTWWLTRQMMTPERDFTEVVRMDGRPPPMVGSPTTAQGLTPSNGGSKPGTHLQESGARCRVRLLDVRGGVPIPDVRLSATRGGPDGQRLEFTTDAEGSAILPFGPRWTWELLEPNLEFLVREPGNQGTDAINDRWCYRTVVVTGYVDVADPARVGTGLSTVSARPISPRLAAAAGGPQSEKIGSPAWVERTVGPARFLWTTKVSKRQYSLEVPLFEDVAIMAWAPGHCPETIRLSPGLTPGATVQADFSLRTGPSIRVRVLDETGVPVSGASVLLVNYWTVPTKDLDRDALRLQKRTSGAGLGILGNDATGTSLVSFQKSCRTGNDGGATLHQGSTEGSLILLIAANGCVPLVERLERPDEFAEAEIVLRKNVPARGGYKLSYKGRFAGSLSSLSLMEPIDGLTLQSVNLTSDASGVFPAASIVPDKDYFAMLVDKTSLGMKFGTVRFGGEEVVDISNFE